MTGSAWAYMKTRSATHFKQAIAQFTAGTESVKNERGTEVFYDFAISPAVRIIPSYQHVWNPLIASVATKQDHADLFLLRFAVTF